MTSLDFRRKLESGGGAVGGKEVGLMETRQRISDVWRCLLGVDHRLNFEEGLKLSLASGHFKYEHK